MNPILKRTLSGLTVGLLVVGLFLYCPLRGLLPIVAVLAALAPLEFYQMAKKKYEPVAWFGMLMGLAWMAAVGVLGFGKGLLAIACYSPIALSAVMFLLCAFVTFNPRYKNPLGTIASTLTGFFYVLIISGVTERSFHIYRQSGISGNFAEEHFSDVGGT